MTLWQYKIERDEIGNQLWIFEISVLKLKNWNAPSVDWGLHLHWSWHISTSCFYTWTSCNISTNNFLGINCNINSQIWGSSIWTPEAAGSFTPRKLWETWIVRCNNAGGKNVTAIQTTHRHTHTLPALILCRAMQTTGSHACGEGWRRGKGVRVAWFSCIPDLCACVRACVCVTIIKQGRQMSPVRRLEVTWDKSACPTTPTPPHTHKHRERKTYINGSGLYINRCPTAQVSFGTEGRLKITSLCSLWVGGGRSLYILRCLTDLQLH